MGDNRATDRHLHGMCGGSAATIDGVGCNIYGRAGCNMLQPTPLLGVDCNVLSCNIALCCMVVRPCFLLNVYTVVSVFFFVF